MNSTETVSDEALSELEIAYCEFCKFFLTKANMKDEAFLVDFFDKMKAKVSKDFQPTPYRTPQFARYILSTSSNQAR